MRILSLYSCFLFTALAPTELYTLSLHDALPIYRREFAIRLLCEVAFFSSCAAPQPQAPNRARTIHDGGLKPSIANAVIGVGANRSEEHTSELQSLRHLVCRLLLEKKKKKHKHTT